MAAHGAASAPPKAFRPTDSQIRQRTTKRAWKRPGVSPCADAMLSSRTAAFQDTSANRASPRRNSNFHKQSARYTCMSANKRAPPHVKQAIHITRHAPQQGAGGGGGGSDQHFAVGPTIRSPTGIAELGSPVSVKGCGVRNQQQGRMATLWLFDFPCMCGGPYSTTAQHPKVPKLHEVMSSNV